MDHKCTTEYEQKRVKGNLKQDYTLCVWSVPTAVINRKVLFSNECCLAFSQPPPGFPGNWRDFGLQHCRDWTRKGECARNHVYMMMMCHKSCGACWHPSDAESAEGLWAIILNMAANPQVNEPTGTTCNKSFYPNVRWIPRHYHVHSNGSNTAKVAYT